MKEHDNRQNKEKRDDIAGQSPAKRAQAAHDIEMHHTLALPTAAACSLPKSY
jgi:hypothetical protein